MQASVEIQVEFGKFFNVDLFQRGYYQLRCYLKFSPKLSFMTEVGHKNRSRRGNDSVQQIDGQIGKSEIFQILYRKEDLKLGDVFSFKVDFLLDILKTEEVFKELDLQLVIEMWFAEDDVGSNSLEKFQLLCHRSLKLNFDPLKGLHSNLSLLFDYFHLSAIILSIHASLLAFKHPVPISIPAIKSLKPASFPPHNLDLTGLELALFGPPIPPSSSNKNIVQAQKLRKLIGCQKHHLMCRYLLSAYESLQSSFELLATSLPSFVHQQFKIEHVDCVSKLEELVLKCKNLSEMNEAEEEDVLQVVNSDLTNLNTQLSILWAQYLELVTSNQQVSSQLAKDNHIQRVKRFAEGFFVREFSMAEALGCFDAGQHKHADISAKVRLSEYFKTVPPLPIECLETDGNHLTLPIIFEDVYSNVVVPPNAIVVTSQPLASSAAAASNSLTNSRKLSRAAQNRWAQRNDSLRNTGAARLTAISSIAPPSQFSNTSSNSTSNTTVPTTVWATKTSLSTTATANEFGYSNVNGNGSSSSGGSCGSGSNLVDISGTKVSLRRDKSTNSTSSQESENQLNIQGPRKKRLSKFRPESLLLLGGSGWQQQQHQLHGSGLDHKGEQVAFDALDCQLVGYKKMDADHDRAPPMIELGTLVSDSVPVVGSIPKNQEIPLCVQETSSLKNVPIVSAESIGITSSSTGNNSAYNGSTNSAALNSSVEIITTATSSAITSSSTMSLPLPSATDAGAPSSAFVTPTATASISTTPQQHHFQTSCFLFSASSLPTLNDDAEEMATPDMNDSCLFVAAAGGGSLPELVGGVTKGSSDASGIARSECLDNLHLNKRPSPSKSPPSPSASVKSLPLFASGAEKDDLSSVVIPANSTTHAASLNCKLHQDDNKTQTEDKSDECIDVTMVALETDCIEPVLDSKDSASYTELEEELDLDKDESSSALRLLTEECEKSTTSLREALSRMPDIDIETSAEPVKEVAKDDLDRVDGKTAGNHAVSSSSVTKPETGQASKKVEGLRRDSRSMQISSHFHSQLISRRLVSKVTDQTVKFSHAKEFLRRVISYQGHFYSDYLTQVSEDPYFWSPEKPLSPPKGEGVHLIICVHGLDGNSTDLRLVRTYLEMSLTSRGRVDFLMSERNQADTFSDFEVMTDRLVQEILYHIDLYSMKPSRISFIGHSLGNIIIRSALSRKEMIPLLPRLHTFLSLSGPHLGMLFNNSGLVNMGIWLMQKWKKSTSLLQLSLKDHHDPRQTFMYRLSQKQGLKFFSNVLLVGSQQDRYVPFHSSRIELCKAALRDTSGMGSVYTEMVTNLLRPVIDDAPQVQMSSSVQQQQQPALSSSRHTVNIASAAHQHSRRSSLQQLAPTSLQSRPPSVFVRYDVYHALTSNTNNLIGRAAHIAVLDSELFIEKFITVSALKYFL